MPKLSEYPARPVGISPNKAQQRGWGGGWPNCQRASIVAVQRAGVTLYVRREIAELVATLLQATEMKYGYDVKPGQSWGYACRPVRGTRTPSNHSWGLAVDINAPANPMGATFRSDIPPGVVGMWWKCGFYWGGWYRGRPDAMHFEYVHRPADVPRHLATSRQFLTGSPAGAGKRPAGQAAAAYAPPPLRLAKPPMRSERVRWVQQRLNAKGASPQLAVDGVWGPRTDQALRDFQKRSRLAVDGVCGPRSHASLAG
jgi:D-alanyl-D-alanine carboxypeptidase/Putative peptidoglycan binding domain